MINLTTSKEIFLKIYPDEQLVNDLISYINKHESIMNKYIAVCEKGKFSKLFKLDAFKKLCITFAYLPYTYKKYEQLGISDEVFYDTMNDIVIWMNVYRYYNNNKYGLEEFNWIQNHLKCEIFKLGRLQFQLSNYFYTAFCKHNDSVIKLGNKCLNIHIPRGERLDIDACYDSFSRAQEFFPKYFPDYPVDIFECWSWIFYSKNALFMNENSNLIKFANLFTKSCDRESPASTLGYIFNIRESNKKLMKNKKKFGYYYDLSTFSPQSSLQKSAKEYIMNGGKLGDAKGQIILPNPLKTQI